MPDFLVRVQDRPPLYEKGYVVDIKPNGAEWGKKELESDNFRIVSVPDSEMTMAEANTWLSPQPGFNNVLRNPKLKYRSKKLNVDLLPARHKAALNQSRKVSTRVDGKNTRAEIAELEIDAVTMRLASPMLPIET